MRADAENRFDAAEDRMCGAPGNRAAQMSLTLTLSRRTGEGIRSVASRRSLRFGRDDGGTIAERDLGFFGCASGITRRWAAGGFRMCGAPGNCAAQMSLTLTLSRRFTLTRSCGAASPATKRERRISSGSGRDILTWARELATGAIRAGLRATRRLRVCGAAVQVARRKSGSAGGGWREGNAGWCIGRAFRPSSQRHSVSASRPAPSWTDTSWRIGYT
jgi:hypothetical protein